MFDDPRGHLLSTVVRSAHIRFGVHIDDRARRWRKENVETGAVLAV